MVRTENAPSFARVTVTQRAKSTMVHLLSYAPELRGEKMQVVEEPITLNSIALALRHDGRKVKEVYLDPEREPLQFCTQNGYVQTTIPEIRGYQMVVFEAG